MSILTTLGRDGSSSWRRQQGHEGLRYPSAERVIDLLLMRSLILILLAFTKGMALQSRRLEIRDSMLMKSGACGLIQNVISYNKRACRYEQQYRYF